MIREASVSVECLVPDAFDVLLFAELEKCAFVSVSSFDAGEEGWYEGDVDGVDDPEGLRYGTLNAA